MRKTLTETAVQWARIKDIPNGVSPLRASSSSDMIWRALLFALRSSLKLWYLVWKAVRRASASNGVSVFSLFPIPSFCRHFFIKDIRQRATKFAPLFLREEGEIFMNRLLNSLSSNTTYIGRAHQFSFTKSVGREH